MNKTFLTTKLTPIIAIILCCILYASGHFQMIIAALLFLLVSYIEYKKELFNSLGFQRKNLNIKNLLIVAPLLGIAIFLFHAYILLPCIIYFTNQPIDFSVFKQYEGNLPALMNLFVYMVFSAAFSEEIVFRGYLMRQFTKFFGSSKISLVINILLFGVVFGYCHAYQGITGEIATGLIGGVLLSIIFHIRKNDLWFNIVVHLFIDIVALVYMYYGWL